MYQRILVPLDGTDTADLALREAMRLAEGSTAHLLLLHAIDDLSGEAEAALKKLSGDDRDDDHAVEQALMRAVKRAAYRIWERRPVVEATVLRV